MYYVLVTKSQTTITVRTLSKTLIFFPFSRAIPRMKEIYVGIIVPVSPCGACWYMHKELSVFLFRVLLELSYCSTKRNFDSVRQIRQNGTVFEFGVNHTYSRLGHRGVASLLYAFTELQTCSNDLMILLKWNTCA